MADYGILASPTEKFKRPTLPFFNSQRLFTNFASKPLFETEYAVMMSPTSILDTKPFSGFRNPFRSDSPNTPKTPEPTEPKNRNWEKLDSRHIGLGIVDSFSNEKSDPKISNPETRMVLFGSQLKIQIPPFPPSVLSPSDSPKSPADFGIKGRNSQVGSFPSSLSRSNSMRKLESDSQSPRRVFTGCLSASEMELSEDYTCVIAHGPNPRTTLIFDDCVIESYSGVASYFASDEKENGFVSERCSFPSESFLSFCHGCKKSLGHGKDIYMYRGERAFCSRECRYQEISMEEEMAKMESNGSLHATCS